MKQVIVPLAAIALLCGCATSPGVQDGGVQPPTAQGDAAAQGAPVYYGPPPSVGLGVGIGSWGGRGGGGVGFGLGW